MYEHIKAFVENPVSFSLFAVAIACFIIHIFVPIGIFIWNKCWGWIDDFETETTNKYLKLFVKNSFRGEVVNGRVSTYLRGDGSTYWAYYFWKNEEDFKSGKDVSGTDFSDRLPEGCYFPNSEELVEKYYGKETRVITYGKSFYMHGHLFIASLLCLGTLTNSFLWETIYLLSMLTCIFGARAIRRLQKKAVSTLNALEEHKADKKAHGRRDE